MSRKNKKLLLQIFLIILLAVVSTFGGGSAIYDSSDVVAVDFEQKTTSLYDFLHEIVICAQNNNLNVSDLLPTDGDSLIGIATQFGIDYTGNTINEYVKLKGTTIIFARDIGYSTGGKMLHNEILKKNETFSSLLSFLEKEG